MHDTGRTEIWSEIFVEAQALQFSNSYRQKLILVWLFLHNPAPVSPCPGRFGNLDHKQENRNVPQVRICLPHQSVCPWIINCSYDSTTCWHCAKGRRSAFRHGVAICRSPCADTLPPWNKRTEAASGRKHHIKGWPIYPSSWIVT